MIDFFSVSQLKNVFPPSEIISLNFIDAVDDNRVILKECADYRSSDREYINASSIMVRIILILNFKTLVLSNLGSCVVQFGTDFF